MLPLLVAVPAASAVACAAALTAGMWLTAGWLSCTPLALCALCVVTAAVLAPLHRAPAVPCAALLVAGLYAALLVQHTATCGRAIGGAAVLLPCAVPNFVLLLECLRRSVGQFPRRMEIWQLYARYLPCVVLPQLLLLIVWAAVGAAAAL